MSTPVPTFPTYSAGVMSLIPLYYVGWADSLLSPSEVKLIKSQIEKLPFLKQEDRQLLKKSSTPAKPPSRQLFRHWINLIRQTAQDLPSEKLENLADLGMEMARKSARVDEISQW